jgi:hypothetical protein
LAGEIQALRQENETLKSTLLKLQTFTMDVNKSLIDRIVAEVDK